MKTSRWPLFFLVLVLGGLFVFGIWRLFVLRFQAGDVYPPYSSLRADPVGTKILHDSLGQTRGFTVNRSFQPLDKIPQPDHSTILYLGASTGSWESEDADGLETLAKKGARVLIAFLPADEAPKRAEASPTEKPKSSEKSKETKDEEEQSAIALSEIAKKWGFSAAYRTEKADADSPHKLIARSMLSETEPVLSWHTALYFDKPDSAWRVLYRCEGKPVLMEKPVGLGSLAVAAEPFFLSNEAMRSERAPRLIAFLAGSRPRLVFEETHLGVGENPGIAALARKYNLGGLFAAIAVLGGLFVWQNASPFLPPNPDLDENQIVTGKDSAAGFVSLLRRSIAPSRLIEICLEQWKKSFAHKPEKWAGTLNRMEAAAAEAGREPVRAYRTISQILAEKK